MESIKTFIIRNLPPGSLGRWIIQSCAKNPLTFSIDWVRSLLATKQLVGSWVAPKVRLGRQQKLLIKRAPSAKINLMGNLLVNDHIGGNGISTLTLGDGAEIHVLGDFEIGPNVHIMIGKDAKLLIRGKKCSTGCGITCDSRIMVEREMEIGHDTIIAWGCYITDSDWHDIVKTERCMPVCIGDNVWISHDVSVLKGARIPSGCIVAAKSLVTQADFPERALIAGVPATVRRVNVEWRR